MLASLTGITPMVPHPRRGAGVVGRPQRPRHADATLCVALKIASKLGKVRSLEAILDFIRRSVMQKGGGDIRGGKKVSNP